MKVLFSSMASFSVLGISFCKGSTIIVLSVKTCHSDIKNYRSYSFDMCWYDDGIWNVLTRPKQIWFLFQIWKISANNFLQPRDILSLYLRVGLFKIHIAECEGFL